jgi:hypothetical protein
MSRQSSAGADSAAGTRGEWLFRLCSAGALLAALFHAAAILSPSVAALEYDSTYPLWRHGVFIVLDTTLGALFLSRPPWLIPLFAIVTAQILYSHGSGAWYRWTREQRIDWISIAILIAAPVALAMLIAEAGESRAEPPTRPLVCVDLASHEAGNEEHPSRRT